MKILVVTISYWPNLDGGAVFEHRLNHQFVAAGHQVAVWTTGPRARSFHENVDGIDIYRQGSLPLPLSAGYRFNYFPWAQARQIFDEVQPDIVHVHAASLIGLAALGQARRRGVPIIATNHLMPENVLLNMPIWVRRLPHLTALFWQVLIWFHNKFDHVTSPTGTADQLLRAHRLELPSEAITNGIDTDLFRPAKTRRALTDIGTEHRDIPLDLVYGLYVGRNDGEKRIDKTIRAFAAMKGQRGAHLVIAGDGTRRQKLQELAAGLGMADRIIFTGKVSNDHKIALMQQARFFVITSPAELQSIVSLEAASCGLPIVAVDIAALRELCRDGDNGYLVPFDDEKMLTARMKQLFADTDLAHTMGKASRRLMLADHSQAHTLDRYLAIYHRLLTHTHFLQSK